MSEIKLIPISLIRTNPNNPRQIVDKNSIIELSESIITCGVLQPITIRCINSNEPQEDDKYELILGSRRLAASELAGLEVIPAIVRDMTDDEALDAMIIENLQRKDIEPLDEAKAFKLLLDKGVDYPEIAIKLGKSEAFIRTRIKLNDLIGEFKDMLTANTILLSCAYELCKIEKNIQNAIYYDHYHNASPENDWSRLTVQELKTKLLSNFYSLKLVDFDTTECKTCIHNTTSSNSLFSEYNDNNCTNISCFQKKKESYLRGVINDCINGNIPIMIKAGNERMIAQLKELGVNEPVLYLSNSFDILTFPVEPDRETLKDSSEEEFQNFVDIYNKDMAVFDANCSALGYTKAYTIGLIKQGCKYLYYKLKEVAKVEEKTSNDTVKEVTVKTEIEKSAEISEQEQIENLKKKDKRNHELMMNKIVEDTQKNLLSSNYVEMSDVMADFEFVALNACLLYSSSVPKLLEMKRNFDKSISFVENVAKLSLADINLIYKSHIKNLICSTTAVSSIEVKAILGLISKKVFSEKTKEIKNTHYAKYEKQKESIEERIKKLSK
jgi:ParB family chromosome partitioning protein